MAKSDGRGRFPPRATAHGRPRAEEGSLRSPSLVLATPPPSSTNNGLGSQIGIFVPRLNLLQLSAVRGE